MPAIIKPGRQNISYPEICTISPYLGKHLDFPPVLMGSEVYKS
jgi:hypothetical protein